ncbi:MAG TPA: hypothetical protein VI248_20210 [Kineosporiaceae bacterium]
MPTPEQVAVALAGRVPDTPVIAQGGDPVHPVPAAAHRADALGARLVVLAAGGRRPWRGRERPRGLVTGHLAVTAAESARPAVAESNTLS